MKCLLLGTAGCHLCEEAEAIVEQCRQRGVIMRVELIDIAENPQWQDDYALRIPVLLHEKSAQALDWPFTETDVIHFLKKLDR